MAEKQKTALEEVRSRRIQTVVALRQLLSPESEFTKSLAKASQDTLAALNEIVNDKGAKPGERVAAGKAIFDMADRAIRFQMALEKDRPPDDEWIVPEYEKKEPNGNAVDPRTMLEGLARSKDEAGPDTVGEVH